VDPVVDIRPTGSSVPATSAIDALRRVQSSAAADDSEDSQTGGYLFSDAKRNPGDGESSEDEQSEHDLLVRDAIELSPAVMADHSVSAQTQDGEMPRESREAAGAVEMLPTIAPERHIDIEA
jgi:hypothetical protein